LPGNPEVNYAGHTYVFIFDCHKLLVLLTRSQAVARIADRTDSQQTN